MLNARLQVRGFDAIAQLVAAGLGVAVLPSDSATRFAKLFDIKVLVLEEPWAHRDYLLATRLSDSLPAAVQRFVDALCPPAAIAAASAATAAAAAAATAAAAAAAAAT